MRAQELKAKRRLRRKNSVRRTISMTATRPRLSVHRTCKHIYAQVIDDQSGRTLAAYSDCASEIRGEKKTKSERAALVGAEIAKRAKAGGVESVVFDRGASKYHGRVKALAEAAREGGLKF